MKFIDLFAGLGGFHLALSRLGHECVFASEIKPALTSLYMKNFGQVTHGDIRRIRPGDIPKHDILCAGFPCQPFSKAGNQRGLGDESNGDLFAQIIRILRHNRPKYFILENVQHLRRHDNEETYQYMSSRLESLGYEVKGEILSPHDFGIPQHRQRLFIVGCLNGLDHFKWPSRTHSSRSTRAYLDDKPRDVIELEAEKQKALRIWQKFLYAIPKACKVPSFPIWSMEFGASYPFEDKTPLSLTSQALGKFRGSFGIPLRGLSIEEKLSALPSHAKRGGQRFPDWKKSYIRANRAFYEEHKTRLQPIVEDLEELGVPSWQKFEWNIQNGARDLERYIIQFRGSGIRLKRPDSFPSLVCVSTQIPIIGWQMRYITKREGARLQGLDSLKFLPENNGTCFDALGNAVNAEIVYMIAKNLLHARRTNGQVTWTPYPSRHAS